MLLFKNILPASIFGVVKTSLFLIIIGLIGFLKLLFLDKLPMFGDEALYCYLGRNFLNESFVTAFDTTVNYWKDAPGLIFLNVLSLRLFGFLGPVIACRLTSVISSLITCVFLFLFLRKTGVIHKISVAASIFYALNSFSFFFDRTNYMDVVQTMWWIIFLYFSVRFLQSGSRLTLASSLFSFVWMFLSKFHALIFLPIIFSWSYSLKVSGIRKRIYIISLIILALVLLAISLYTTKVWDTVFYHVSKELSVIALANRLFTNMKIIINFFRQFLTEAGLILFLIGFRESIRRRVFFFVFIFISIIIFYALVASNLFPRYFLLSLPFFATVTAFSVYNRTGLVAFIFVVIFMTVNNFTIITRPEQARIAEQTNFEYFTDWGSGIGPEKLMKFLSLQKTLPEILVVPVDLQGLFFIYKDVYLQDKKLNIVPISNINQLDQMLNQSGKPVLLATSKFQKWLVDVVEQDFDSRLLYSTNKEERNSVFLYEIH